MKQESPMSRKLTLKNIFKRFTGDQDGTIAVMFALSTVPILLATGAAVDFVRFNAAQTHVQAALDAATLSGAAAKKVTDAKRIEIAKLSFKNNIASGAAAGMSADPEFKVVKDKFVSEVKVEMPTALMKIVGIDVMNGTSRAEVGIIGDQKAEIVMVLDYSGSMGRSIAGKTKYIAMKDAAKAMVNDLAKSDPDKVKFGLVPFSHHVYTTLPSSMVIGGTGATWTGCTQDRQYPYNQTTSAPTGDDATKWNHPFAPRSAGGAGGTCDPYVTNNLSILDLTKDFSGIKSKLDAMKPYSNTHIALGVEFGYHMLSPAAPFTSGVSFSDTSTKKFMVVLTDGEQTEPAFGPGGSRTKENGETNLEKLCANAKADGITIMTMAFDLDDSATRKRLQNCATDPKRDFFVVNDPTGLSSAFEAVKTAIADQVFISK
jgi:Flp pilus assembly protein TadG